MSDVAPLPPRLSPHFPDLTTGTLNGKGLFDLLMGATKEHLMEEFNSQRLRGTDYSKVYLGSMESALSNAVQYLIGMGLIDAQLEKLAAETALVKFQLEKEQQLLPLEIKKVIADTDLVKAQIDSEKTLLPLRVRQTEAEIKRIDAEIDQIRERNKLIPYEIKKIEKDIEATTAEIGKIEKDKLLIQEQIREAKFRTDFLLPAEKGQIEAQTLKLHQEDDLVKARTLETQENKKVLEAQAALTKEQAATFAKDLAIKKQKIVADAWSAMIVADPTWGGGPRDYNESGL